jgi:hypothetical protein
MAVSHRGNQVSRMDTKFKSQPDQEIADLEPRMRTLLRKCLRIPSVSGNEAKFVESAGGLIFEIGAILSDVGMRLTIKWGRIAGDKRQAQPQPAPQPWPFLNSFVEVRRQRSAPKVLLRIQSADTVSGRGLASLAIAPHNSRRAV